jgi:SET domain
MKVVVLNNFAVGETHLGKSVFAARAFKRGDVVTQFEGEILHKSEIPKSYRGERDRYMQIGVDEYLGPSGNTDDLINHSCEPNCGLKFTKSGVLLVAIKNINIGDEITWDYSTTLFENSWRMKCDCRSELCRKIIGDFALLDQALQKKYQRFGVIPPYIKAYLMSQEYSVYTKGIQHLSRHEGKEK